MTNLIGKKVTVKKGAGNYYTDCTSRDAAYLIITRKDSDTFYLWEAYDKDGKLINNCSGHNLKESDFLPYKRDMTTLEQGDVLVDKSGARYEVLDVHGRVIDISSYNNFDNHGASYTKEELIEDGFTLEGQEAPVEEIVIDGKRYLKSEVEERIKELKSL